MKPLLKLGVHRVSMMFTVGRFTKLKELLAAQAKGSPNKKPNVGATLSGVLKQAYSRTISTQTLAFRLLAHQYPSIRTPTLPFGVGAATVIQMYVLQSSS